MKPKAASGRKEMREAGEAAFPSLLGVTELTLDRRSALAARRLLKENTKG